MRLNTTEGSRRKRLSRAQGQALAEQWRESGETVAAFCRREEAVGVQTLRYWIARGDQAEKSVGRSGDFFVVSAPPTDERRSQLARATAEQPGLPKQEKQLRNTVIVVLPLTSVQGLAQTVQALLHEVST